MVKAVREAEQAIGKVGYTPTEKKIKGRSYSRSLYVVNDIKKEEVITEKHVRNIRPGFGEYPKAFKSVLGKKLLLTWIEESA